jgi:ABC-type hemin transport system ATPase subunit
MITNRCDLFTSRIVIGWVLVERKRYFKSHRTGALAAVVGMVGSGKSSLLGCILGEMRKVSGKVRAHSHPIAGSYCMHLSHHYVVLTHN